MTTIRCARLGGRTAWSLAALLLVSAALSAVAAPIASQTHAQSVRSARAADVLEAARGLVYRAARLAAESKRGGKGTEIHKLAAAAVLFTAEAAARAVDHAVQIHGGYGYIQDSPVNRLYRDAKLYEIGAGTSEIRRLVIANELLKNN